MDIALLGILFFVLFVVAPPIFWFRFFAWEDRAEPEPKKLLRYLFLLGIGVGFLALPFNHLSSFIFPDQFALFLTHDPELSFAWGVLFVGLAGPVEEYLKYLAIRSTAYRMQAFNQAGDGLIYGVTVGLGFSFLENISYFLTFLSSGFAGFTFVGAMTRGIVTMMLHLAATGTSGLYLGKAKFSPIHRKRIIAKGLLFAVMIHSAYNVLVTFDNEYLSLSAYMLVFAAFIVVLHEINKPDMKMVWRLVGPQGN